MGAAFSKPATSPGEAGVSIIFLNWNSHEVTLACLRSLQKIDDRNFEIVLVGYRGRIRACEG